MIYTFVQTFDPYMGKYISDEDKLKIAILKCVEELAKALVENAEAHIELDGSVKIKVKV